MKRVELTGAIKNLCILERCSLATERSYIGTVCRFFDWCKARNDLNENRVSDFLAEHASRWSESTQRSALCALVFAFRAIGKPLGKLPDWTKAQRPRRLPEWLSDTECKHVFSFLRGDVLLGCSLMYGSGLRVSECASLRWRDLSFEHHVITVRAGKGSKDRSTCLPVSLIPSLLEQRARAEIVWREDRVNRVPGVFVPDEIGRKQPHACESFGLFWVFPALNLSQDPRSGIIRRHHIHVDTFAKAIATAAKRAGIQKRITPHSCRHSFAVAYLTNGGGLHELQELLGHSTIQTTSIYIHVLPQLAGRITSPLDVPPSKVIPFSPALPSEQEAAHGHFA